MRLQRKVNAWIETIIPKFTNPEMLVVDACAGKPSVAKGHILCTEHSMFIVREVNISCVSETIPRLILLYAQRELSKRVGH